ncbi:MAG: Ig-like domain-containing protein, partial [Acidimicrobiales bacterium]
MGGKAPQTHRVHLSVVAWLLTTLLVIPVVPAGGAELPIPQLSLWESQMVTVGQQRCADLAGPSDDSKFANTYYDAQRVFYQIADYTGDTSWNACAQDAERHYRDYYVLPNNGGVPGYWNFTTGLRMDFERTGDLTSKNAALLLNENAAYSVYRPDVESPYIDFSREVAYAILGAINAEKLGEPRHPRRQVLVDQAYGHLDQWFVTFGWQQNPPPENQSRLAPFMVGLTAHSLVRDWEETGDSRLIPTLQRAADWMWANAWMPAYQAMWYENLDQTAGGAAPDLNLLIAPIYAFLYRQTGDTKYRDQGDQLFAGGVQLAWLGAGKQFDQSYWWSFDYVNWRTAGPIGPPDSSPPTVSVTAPTNGATVSGPAVTVSATASDDVGVARVQFTVDGTNLGAAVTTLPFSITWNTATTGNGSHVLRAQAYDAAGNVGTSGPVTVTVANSDTTPPTVSLTSPTSGQTVSGTVTVTASASDNVGVTRLDYLVDGQILGVFSPPAYTFAWNTTTVSNGSHTLSARGHDAAGNVGTSASVTVTVANPVAGISVNPTSITFTGAAGGPFPAPQTLQITNPTGGSWSTFDTSPFYDVGPTSGTGTGTVTATPHTETLAPGTYTHPITVSAPGLT